MALPRMSVNLVLTLDTVFPAGSDQIVFADFQSVVEIARPCWMVLGQRGR